MAPHALSDSTTMTINGHDENTSTKTGKQEHPILKRDLAQYSRRRSTSGQYADNLEVDVLIVGAGFGGIYLLHEMRQAGYKTVIYEAGTSLGGVWRFNAYPGARTDSEVPGKWILILWTVGEHC